MTGKARIDGNIQISDIIWMTTVTRGRQVAKNELGLFFGKGYIISDIEKLKQLQDK